MAAPSLPITFAAGARATTERLTAGGAAGAPSAPSPAADSVAGGEACVECRDHVTSCATSATAIRPAIAGTAPHRIQEGRQRWIAEDEAPLF